ncbi:MAG: hypothetical protein O7A04_02070, partial [Acidobacteria bacterium]|nr:hypothetical protein [Acidobacteriota bacterium]
MAIPASGVAWRIDAAEWILESGSLRLQEPVDGVVTGLWFEGHGRLRLPVPDPIELRQLRRLLKNPALDILALSFDRMLLRSSGGPPSSLFPAPTAGGSRL